MKWLFALLLALAIFGGAAYFAYNVLFKQEIAVQKEQRGEIPATPLPDLSLPEFQEAAKLRQEGNLAEAHGERLHRHVSRARYVDRSRWRGVLQ